MEPIKLDAGPDIEDWGYHDFVNAWQQVDSAVEHFGNQATWSKVRLAGGVEKKYGALGQLAADVGVEYSTLRTYRSIDQAYPVEEFGEVLTRINISVAHVFMAQEDRLALLESRDRWTVAEARILVQERNKVLEASGEPAAPEVTFQPPEPSPPPADPSGDSFLDLLDSFSSGGSEEPEETLTAASVPAPEPVWSDEELELRKKVEQGETVVASMRSDGHPNLILWANQQGLFTRIDRRTVWGNPFELPDDGTRAEVIAHYAEHYLPYKPALLAQVNELVGCVLGCWCAPEPCHGHVLRWLAYANGDQAPTLEEELPAMLRAVREKTSEQFVRQATVEWDEAFGE